MSESVRLQKALVLMMSEMNQKLDKTINAINNLTKKAVDIAESNGYKPGAVGDNIKLAPNSTGNFTSQKLSMVPHRGLGYVNWQQTHTDRGLQNQRLVKVADIRAAVALLLGVVGSTTFSQGKHALSYMSENQSNKHVNNTTTSTTTVTVKTIDKETRFPSDAVYVDTNLPHVKAEIDFLRQVNVRPTDGVIERFMAIIEKEMHTTRTFEEKYALKWQ